MSDFIVEGSLILKQWNNASKTKMEVSAYLLEAFLSPLPSIRQYSQASVSSLKAGLTVPILFGCKLKTRHTFCVITVSGT